MTSAFNFSLNIHFSLFPFFLIRLWHRAVYFKYILIAPFQHSHIYVLFVYISLHTMFQFFSDVYILQVTSYFSIYCSSFQYTVTFGPISRFNKLKSQSMYKSGRGFQRTTAVAASLYFVSLYLAEIISFTIIIFIHSLTHYIFLSYDNYFYPFHYTLYIFKLLLMKHSTKFLC